MSYRDYEDIKIKCPTLQNFGFKSVILLVPENKIKIGNELKHLRSFDQGHLES